MQIHFGLIYLIMKLELNIKKNKMKLYVDITKRTFIEYKANGFNTKRKVQKWKKKASKIDHKSTKDHYSSLNLVR